jgi:hypothetical protein
MKEYKHWADALESGDRVLATIRHETDGSKNLIDVQVIVTGNNRRECKISAAFLAGLYVIPYNELSPLTPKPK